jgi:hypothetical protein
MSSFLKSMAFMGLAFVLLAGAMELWQFFA